MRKVIVGAFVSLDGVMQAPGGPQEDTSGGFEHGGWVAGYWDDTVGDFMGEDFRKPFDLLLGRRTYDIFAAYWPPVGEDPAAPNHAIGAAFNKAVKYIATHYPDSLTWAESRGLGDDVVGAVGKLKAGDGPPLLTQGSSELVHQLLAAGLVDEIRLITFPILLGKGKRLFDENADAAGFRIEKSTVTAKGVVIATYQRAGEVKTGDFTQQEPTDAEIERRKGLA
jgi:dihydrofolate reductase